MRFSLLLCLLLITITTTYAQQDNSGESHNTWVLKGKVLPWISIGPPLEGINYTLGAEYGFSRVNAIGFELVYNDNQSHEDYSPANGQGDSAGLQRYTVSRGVFVYYRRYLDMNNTFVLREIEKLFNSDCLPYVSAFTRYGKLDYHYEPGYPTRNVSYDEWQYSGGALFGVVCKVFDINMGPFYKQTNVSDVEKLGTNTLYSHMKPSFGFRVGVNLFWVLKKNSDHLLAKYKQDN